MSHSSSEMEPSTLIITSHLQTASPQELTMGPITKKRQRNGDSTATRRNILQAPRVFPNPAASAATENDKKKWNGFCEIESDPAFFGSMLEEFGVKGLKVKEIVSLDEVMLESLPRPVHGIIFLFKWKEDDPIKQETSCPPEVWFANQTVSNACASVALLNIVNNIPGIELGEPLAQFKEFTRDFTPALRGNAISNFKFVKEIHNSFARKMDMLNGDLALKNEKSAKNKSSKKSKANLADDESSAGFHFIAFVPIEDKVWKLDGLERQPQNLGPIKGKDWLIQAKPDIEARMAEYDEGQIEFAILSVVQNPMINLLSNLAANVKTLSIITSHLESVKPGWKSFSTEHPSSTTSSTIWGPDPSFNLTVEAISEAPEPAGIMNADDADALLSALQTTVTDQASIRRVIKEEQQSNRMDEEKANSRRHDYGPAIKYWLEQLASRDLIKELKVTSRG